MTRLTDEQVRCLAEVDGARLTAQSSLTIYALAREVQAWRRLVNGGPCETCDGDGSVERDQGDWIVEAPCPDCHLGTRPGLIERLEHEQEGYSDWPAIDAIIDDLRRMGQ